MSIFASLQAGRSTTPPRSRERRGLLSASNANWVILIANAAFYISRPAGGSRDHMGGIDRASAPDSCNFRLLALAARATASDAFPLAISGIVVTRRRNTRDRFIALRGTNRVISGKALSVLVCRNCDRHLLRLVSFGAPFFLSTGPRAEPDASARGSWGRSDHHLAGNSAKTIPGRTSLAPGYPRKRNRSRHVIGSARDDI